ncbi:hypothetical protein BH10PAT1_BH10PAT1_5530 [soil metagenome]
METVNSSSTETPIQKPFPVFNLICGIVILILLSMVTFLGYKNMQLQKEIAGMKVIPTPSATAIQGWKEYKDTNIGFTIQYPSNYSVEYLEGQPLINRRITWFSYNQSISDEKGGGSIIKSEVDLQINNINVKKFTLEHGSVGGGIPQSEIRYEIPKNDDFVVFSLTELSQPFTPEMNMYKSDRIPEKISSEDEANFDQIVSTFKFTN